MIAKHYVGGLIQDAQGRFLLIHDPRKSDIPWRIPGGKVEKKETSEQALVRELFEELGIAAEELEYAGVTEKHVDGGFWVGTFFFVNSFTGFPEIPEAEREKHDDWGYFSYDEVMCMQDLAEGETLRVLLKKGPRVN